ncbi:MAG: glutaredoxin domain-containing protein [Fidelibacterota bacterium]
MKAVKTIKQLKSDEKLKLVLFYTDKSQKSLEALEIFKGLQKDYKDVPIYTVNAGEVKTIHPEYNIDSVPALLVIRNNASYNVIYGKQKKSYYEMLFQEAPILNEHGEEVAQPNVTVYSTPTCVYCNQLKSYLRKNRVSFTDVDVAADPNAARELQQRTGQTGVPQTDIDGEIIVGFDRARINELLEINTK